MAQRARLSQAQSKVRKSRAGDLEMSTLIKWVLLIIFLILVLIIIMLARQSGDETIGTLCERTGGLMGC